MNGGDKALGGTHTSVDVIVSGLPVGPRWVASFAHAKARFPAEGKEKVMPPSAAGLWAKATGESLCCAVGSGEGGAKLLSEAHFPPATSLPT